MSGEGQGGPAPGGRDAARWYAVHLRSNHERGAASFLEDRDVPVFLPTYRVRSRRTDRTVQLERPLFPGYLFVQLDLAGPGRLEVLRAPGTVRIVGFSDQPAAVDDEVIESLRILVGRGEDDVRPHPLLREGQRVRVGSGPFRGAVGRLQHSEGRRPRLVVEVEFLGRAVAVPVTVEDLEPCFG